MHGSSQKEKKHLRRQVKFIQTLSVDLSVRKLFTMTTLWNAGNMTAAEEKGLVSEGKDYVMKDGDIVLF